MLEPTRQTTKPCSAASLLALPHRAIPNCSFVFWCFCLTSKASTLITSSNPVPPSSKNGAPQLLNTLLFLIFSCKVLQSLTGIPSLHSYLGRLCAEGLRPRIKLHTKSHQRLGSESPSLLRKLFLLGKTSALRNEQAPFSAVLPQDLLLKALPAILALIPWLGWLLKFF